MGRPALLFGAPANRIDVPLMRLYAHRCAIDVVLSGPRPRSGSGRPISRAV